MNADSIARWYRWIEYAAFGRALERYRFCYLDRLSSARRILILGEGDGRVLSRLLPLAPFARIDVVDSSPQMVELAGRRITHQHQHRVKFHCQDVFERTWGASEFDAVVTCFFLDCFTEVQARRVIRRIVRALAPGGIWLVSEFAIPEKGWRKWNARLWVWSMYRFFRLFTGLRAQALAPIGRILAEAGLHRSESATGRAGLVVSEVWKKAPSPTFRA